MSSDWRDCGTIERSTNYFKAMYSSTTARQLDAELRELERRNGPSLAVPDTYEQFAAGLVISSGGEKKQMFLYQYQRVIALLLKRFPSVMIIKSRQLGISELGSTHALWEAARNPAFNAVMFSLTNQDLSSISKRISSAIANNKFGLKAETENVTVMKLVRGGTIAFRSFGGKSAARGLSAQDLIFDECAFADNLDELLGAAAATTVLSNDPNFTFISTPSSPGCTYYAMLSEVVAPLHIEEVCKAVADGKLYSFGIPGFMHIPSKDGKSVVVLTHFSAHPVYAQRENFLDERAAIEKVSRKNLLREYNLEFSSGVGAYFTAAQIAKVAILPPIGRSPVNDKRFEVVIGIDPAGGAQASKKKSPDYCVAFILLRDKYTRKVSQVGMYRSNTLTSAKHLENLVLLLQLWKPDRVVVDSSGLGGVFYSALKLKFPTLDLVAHNTSAKKKITGYGRVTYLIENDELAIWNSPAIKKELTELQDTGSKIEAPPLGHDDIAFALLLAVAGLQDVDDENAD
jgi:Terminase large subunit, T4likevirus-type, N-terminal/Terminase RNaseH-like domain